MIRTHCRLPITVRVDDIATSYGTEIVQGQTNLIASIRDTIFSTQPGCFAWGGFPSARVVDTKLRLWVFGNRCIPSTAAFPFVESAHPKPIQLASSPHLAEQFSGVFAR
jgi:hypothetical protein